MSTFNKKYLHQITVSEKADRINESLSWAVRSQLKSRDSVEITLFKLAEWVAVPATREIMINPMLQEHLQRTFLAHGYCELYAVRLDNEEFPVYILPVTLEAIDEFRRKMGAFCYALFTGDVEPDWVLIAIESELYVIAGPSEFVCQFLDCKIEEAFSRFQNFVIHEPMPQQLRKYLHLVYDRLKDNYQSAVVGTEFRLSP
ncbi:hypothetical protein NIES2119_31735 [[Phormidium ambiguum] IAM M-71]|uniref:Uncharacterized protein n=1 Tax=[Phormidium ambiguum] IAM M-71 TaxID=454136 RepID=A0A1U7I1V1_9CYAN|nr:hypothetical protein [Phormidium ambiguum]OKH29944.1 hypothetical protein NIES2119_31735 [Phormidium ambiguum IAM M-71]